MLVLAEARDSKMEVSDVTSNHNEVQVLYVCGLAIDELVRETTLSRECEQCATALQEAVAVALAISSTRFQYKIVVGKVK
jgi:hypothetical protein